MGKNRVEVRENTIHYAMGYAEKCYEEDNRKVNRQGELNLHTRKVLIAIVSENQSETLPYEQLEERIQSYFREIEANTQPSMNEDNQVASNYFAVINALQKRGTVKRIKKTKLNERKRYKLGCALREVPNKKRKARKKNEIYKREAVVIHRSYSPRLQSYVTYAQPTRYSNKKKKQAKNRSERKQYKQNLKQQFNRYVK